MPRATVQPMTAENGRPLYPKTQFATHNPNIPRVHMGDTSQPMTGMLLDKHLYCYVMTL